MKLRAYRVFFSVPKIKYDFCSALGGALDAVSIPPPKMLPPRDPTLYSALLQYPVSKA